MLIRPGLVDESRTEVLEVLSGALKEGNAVVVLVVTPETERASRLTPNQLRHFGGH